MIRHARLEMLIALLLFCISCEDVNVSSGPTVISTFPPDGATNVATTITLTARFSKVINPSSITPMTFRVNNGVTGTVSSVGNTASFIPSQPLAFNTTFTATITTGVTDRQGNAMESDFSWSFTTRPPPPKIIGFSPDSGRIGSTVIITGINFASEEASNSVRFSGISAEVLDATSTKIITKVPPGATDGPITVTTPGGQAVSAKHFIIIRPGSIWTAITSGTTSTLSSVVWVGELFVAVGASGTVLTSSDGTNWTKRTSGTTSWLSGIASSGERIVVVGSGGTIITSDDGTEWTEQFSDVSVALLDIAWSGSQFATTGGSGIVLISRNGIGWQEIDTETRVWLYGVTWFDPLWVVTGHGGIILTSSDTYIWIPRHSGTARHLLDVILADTLLVAVGYDGTILTSSDGVTWQPRQSGTTQHLGGIAWSGTLLVAVGTGGTILTSPDGIHWQQKISPTSDDLNDVAWSHDRFVAVGVNGTVLISE